MPDANETKPNKTVERHEREENSQRGLWIIICVGVFALIAVVVVGSFWVNSQRIRFITEFSLTAVLATLVAVQTYIYLRQSKMMEQGIAISEQALKVSNRAYVGVHSITEDFKNERIILTIENTGNVPAEDLKVAGEVWIIIPRREGLAALRNPLFESASCAFNRTFRNTRLFRGNLKARIAIDLFKITLVDKTCIPSVTEGHGTLMVMGSIEYGDGFAPAQISQFAFTYEGGEWAARGVDDPEVMKKEKRAKEK